MFEQFPPPKDYRLFRYGVISPLLCRGENDPPLNTAIQVLASKSFLTPYGQLRKLSASVIKDWYYRYLGGGIDSLANRPRGDQGTTTVPHDIQKALCNLRQAHPHLTVKRLFDKLKKQELWNGRRPSKSALYRFTSTNNLNRDPAAPMETVHSFEFPCFGDLWSADFLHGPKVQMGRSRPKSYLNLIIDDATRYVVAASFHLAEDIRSFLADFLMALRRFGIPKRLYTDNGAAYRSTHLLKVCAKLGVAMPHTPPYKPRGRGKVERLFRFVREGFLDEYTPTTLQQLNKDFSEWIVQYHKRPHSALGMSPLNRKLIDDGPELKHIPATQNVNDIFRMTVLKKVGSDGCIRIMKKRFEVRDAYPGEKIEVHYLPWDTDYVLTGADMLIAKVVDTHKNSARFNKPRRRNSNNNDKEKKS
ncbi:MAG: DDE-type integrase/transposase/recombinase [Chitinivibrionales bacterium]|nr:DDE-type integrase/transposase/recombinase [Chitinivibrionales bacterium]